jgi:uncharacterized phage-associated protein
MGKLAKGERLSPKLEAVLARLCQRLGALATTRAVKLPYLVDVVAAHYLGRPITDGTHQTWDHGVVTNEVWSYIQNGGDIQGPFDVTGHNLNEKGGKQISLGGVPDDELSPDEETIVDLVADNYGRLDADSLGRLTKTLNTHFDKRVWGKNQKAAVNEDAYARLSEGYQAFANRLQHLNFADEKKWGEPIDNPYEYLRRKLGG